MSCLKDINEPHVLIFSGTFSQFLEQRSGQNLVHGILFLYFLTEKCLCLNVDYT